MKSPKVSHLVHYLILLVMMFLGLTGIIFLGSHSSLRIILVLLISAAYLVWGVVHHLLEGTLNKEIFIEYLLYSLMGTAFIFSVLRFL